MSDQFDLNKPCKDQGLTGDALMRCQEARNSARRNKIGAPKLDESGEDKSKKVWGIESLEERRQKIDDMGFLNWYSNYTDGGEIMKSITNSWRNTDRAIMSLDDRPFGQKAYSEKDIEIRNRLIGSIKENFDAIEDEYKTGTGSINDENFVALWREQDGFQEKYLSPTGRRAGWQVESGYKNAVAKYDAQKIEKQDQDILKQYGQDVLKAFKDADRDVMKMDLNAFDKETIDGLVWLDKKRDAETFLDDTGERDVSRILYPALDKYMYGEGDRDEDGFLPNERIAYENERVKQQWLRDGCGSVTTLENNLKAGETWTIDNYTTSDQKRKARNCAGKEYTLQAYKTGDEYEQYKKGINEISKRGETLQTALDTAIADSKDLLDDLTDQKKILDSYGIVNGRTSDGIIPKPEIQAAYNADVKKYQELAAKWQNSPEAAELKKLSVQSDLITEEYKKLEELGEKYQSVAMVLEAGMLNYNLLDKLGATLSSTFVDPVLGAFKQLDATLGKAVGTYDDIIRYDEKGNVVEAGEEGYENALTEYEQQRGVAMNYFKVAGERLNQFSASTGAADFGRDGFTVTRYLASMFVDNSPSILAVLGPSAVAGFFGRQAAKGLTGMAAKKATQKMLSMGNTVTQSLFFVSGTADQWGKLTLASYEGEKELKRINALLEDPNLNQAEKNALLKEQNFYLQTKDDGLLRRGFSSLLYGGADWFAERYIGSMRVVKNLQKLGPMYRNKGLFGPYRKSLIDGIKSTVASGYRFTAGIGAELLEESFVNLATAAVDRNILGLDRGYLDDFSKDFALNTAFTSIVMQGPFMANNVMSGLRYELATNADRKAQRVLHGKLMGIQNQINNANNLGLSENQVKELEAQKEKLFNESTIADFLTFNNWTKLDQTKRDKLVDLGGEIREAERTLNELTGDPQFGTKGLLTDIKAAEAKLKELDAKKADLLKSEKLGDFEKQAEEARKENKELQTVDNIIAKSRVQVYEASLDIANFQFDGETKVLDSVESIQDYIDEEGITDPTEVAGIYNNPAFVNPKTGQIVVNQVGTYLKLMDATTTSAEAFTAAIAPLHELLHVQIKKAGIFDTKGDVKLESSINNSIEGLRALIETKKNDGIITDSRGNEILKRIDQYKGKDGKYNLEEVITTFSEAVIAGDLKKSDFAGLLGVKSMLNTVFAKINGGASSILNPFTSTDGIFNFVSNFTNKLGDTEFVVNNTYTMDSTGRMKREAVEEKDLKFSKIDKVSIPAEYDVERIETNLELNKDVGQTFLREDNRKILEAQLARAKKVEAFIDESPEDLRKKLANETNPENKADLEYALKRQQEVRFPGNVGITDPLTGDPIATKGPKGLAFSVDPTKITENLAGKGLEVSEKQINDMVNKITSRATTKFWSRMSASNQNIVPRKLYKDSARNLLLEIANNYRKEISKNTGKQVTFESYMANTGMQRLNSLAKDLGAKQKDDKSLSDDATLRKAEKQQTTEETTVAKPEVAPTTEIFDAIKSINPDINVKDFEKKFTDAVIANAKKQGVDISDPNLTPKQRAKITPYDVLAEALGMDPKKISNPKQNLNQDVKKVQRFLFKASQLVKTAVLSKAYTDVQTVASKVKGGKPVKVGGTTLGYGKDLLNEFFNEPKRLGSGKYVRSPKQWSKARYEKAIGIKDGKIDPNYVARKEQEQMMKAILKALAEQMSLRATSRTLDKGPQTQTVKETQAGLDSMKAGLLFSLNPQLTSTEAGKQLRKSLQLFGVVGDIAVNQNLIDVINEINNTKYKAIPRKNNKYQWTPELKKQRRAWIRGLAESGFFPKEFFNSVNFAATGAKYGKSLYNSVAEIKADLKGIKFKDTKNERATRTKYKNLGPAGMKKLAETQRFKDNEARKMPYLKQIAEGIQNDLKNNPENLPFWTAFMRDTQDGSGSFLRALAPITFYSNVKGKVVEEHSMPASSVGNFILASAAMGNIKNDFDFIKKNYFQGALLESDDKKLKGPWFNYISNMPPAFFTMDNLTTWVRYNNPDVAAIKGGINFNNYQVIDKNITVSQELAQLGMDVAVGKVEGDNVKEDGKKFKDSKEGKKALEQLKNDQQKDLSNDFNDIIEQNKGIESEKRFSEIVAKRRGRNKGRFRFFIPPGAEDFKGLLYNFLGKGKKGEQQWQFFDKNLLKPYWQAVAQIERARRALKGDYAALLKASPAVRKKLGTKIPTKGKTAFTYDHAIRAYLMDQSGYDLVADAGLSKRDAKALVDAVKNDPEVQLFAQGLQMITKDSKWVKPTSGFDIQTIQSDIHRFTSGEGRKKFLNNSGFMQNVDQIFSTENLRKIEAAYGTNLREALEDTIYRMKNGTNRQSGTNKLTNTFNNWINRSVGAIMFFNRKSALLQTISSVNFINWSDNNPLKAGIAFANQKQYWKDFAFIFNSPKLKERRAGLKGDINEAELADAVRGATNKAEAALSWLLKQGFLPTQMADSFAIASGGATFYRNRINTYLKQGMDQQAAEKKAWEDFSRISEESQQSADPAMISEQQASPLGRFTLNFQNTPMQYTRLMKRAGQDLINRRRIPGMTQAQSDRTYISKIIYYGAIQNFIFSALQNALFAVIPGFGGEDDEEELTSKEQMKRKKELKIANSMIDTILRGTGVYGAIAATIKNTAIKFYENEEKDPFAKDNADIILEAANLSPVVGSKLRKLNNALKTREFEKDVIEERGWEITRDGKVNLSPSYNVLGSTAEALLNIPLERTIAEIDALVEMTDQRNSSLERIALALGWRTWDIGVPNEEEDQIKIDVKEQKKQERKDKLRREREEKKRLEEEKRFEGKSDEEIELMKTQDEIRDLTKAEQVNELSTLGLSKKDIRALRLEEDRINKIIELREKKKAKQ